MRMMQFMRQKGDSKNSANKGSMLKKLLEVIQELAKIFQT